MSAALLEDVHTDVKKHQCSRPGCTMVAVSDGRCLGTTHPAPRSFTIRVEVEPKTKGRPRLGRRRKVYTPQDTLDAEALVARAWQDAGGPCFEGPVRMDIVYDKHGQSITITEVEWRSKMRGDLDNYIKLTGDGLNKIAYLDDRQVMALSATKL